MAELNEKEKHRDEKRNQIKKILKDKLNVTNINDLVLCDRNYSGGLFGCLVDPDHSSFPKNLGHANETTK